MKQSLLEVMNGNAKYISILERIKAGDVLLNKDILELENYININISYQIAITNLVLRNKYLKKSLYEITCNNGSISFKVKNKENILFNTKLWGELYDWNCDGDEWCDMAEFDKQDYSSWKKGIYEYLISPFTSETKNILEIAVGHGRWTSYLLKKYKSYTGIDISEDCIAFCQKKFSKSMNASFILGNGSDLKSVSNNSIDFIFSFDSFVHIDEYFIRQYIKEFSRVLSIGGVGVIHHSGRKTENQIHTDGYRTSFSAEIINNYLRVEGLTVIKQISRWGSNNQFSVDKFQDIITFFSKS